MHNKIKKILVLGMAVTASNITVARTQDSADVFPPPVVSAVETYLLANGRIATSIGAYDVKLTPTNLRCPTNSVPIFQTSLISVDVYGSAQAIEGVRNTLALNRNTYEISGRLSAPVNVAARDNGATVSWQIWCEPPTPA